nr:unnamed protein product [Callosobruchus analis]
MERRSLQRMQMLYYGHW